MVFENSKTRIYKICSEISKEDLENLRKKLPIKQEDSSKAENITDPKESEDTVIDKSLISPSVKDNSWEGLVCKISTAAGSVGNVVSSSVSSLPKLPYRILPESVSTKTNVDKNNKSPANINLQALSRPKLTDTEYLEKTRKLISELDKSMASSLEDPSSCIRPLENFCFHLREYELKAGVSTKDTAVSKILQLRKNCKEEEGISLQIREALGLLGYHDPPFGRGPRILSIDGGGTRGIVACKMLKALEEGTGQPIHKLFDLICGVSTGSILASLLGFRKMPIEDVEKVYLEFASQIFNQNMLYGAKGFVSSHSWYDTKFYEGVLKKICAQYGHEEVSMNDFYSSKEIPLIAIVATNVTQERLSPYVFRSYQLPRKTHTSYKGSSRHPVWAAVRASTAAPGYFDDFVHDDKVFEDGGILVNNPTQIAIHEAQKIWPEHPLQCVVSLGLGRTDKFMQDEPKAQVTYLSLKDKFNRIVDSATDTELVHLTLEDLITKKGIYYRFNPYLKEFTYLDDVRETQFDMMREYSRMYIRRNQRKFSDACYELTKSKGPHHHVIDYFHLQRDLFKGKYF